MRDGAQQVREPKCSLKNGQQYGRTRLYASLAQTVRSFLRALVECTRNPSVFGLCPNPSKSTANNRYLAFVAAKKLGNKVSVQNLDDDINPCMNNTFSLVLSPIKFTNTKHVRHVKKYIK